MDVIIASMLIIQRPASTTDMHSEDVCNFTARLCKYLRLIFYSICPLNRKKRCSLGLFLTMIFFLFASPAWTYEMSKLISSNDPYYEPVTACHYLGIIYPDGGAEVRLEQSLNRYQVAHITILTLEALGVEVSKDKSKMRYRDIPASHWAIDDVAGCVNLGLMGGFADLTFQGSSNMLKEHWLAMSSVLAIKFAPEPSLDQAQTPPRLRDLPTLNWLWDPINTLGKYGWLDPSVMDDDFLNRNDSVTRRVLYWYLGKLILAVKGPVDTWAVNSSIKTSPEQAVVFHLEASSE